MKNGLPVPARKQQEVAERERATHTRAGGTKGDTEKGHRHLCVCVCLSVCVCVCFCMGVPDVLYGCVFLLFSVLSPSNPIPPHWSGAVPTSPGSGLRAESEGWLFLL